MYREKWAIGCRESATRPAPGLRLLAKGSRCAYVRGEGEREGGLRCDIQPASLFPRRHKRPQFPSSYRKRKVGLGGSGRGGCVEPLSPTCGGAREAESGVRKSAGQERLECVWGGGKVGALSGCWRHRGSPLAP